MRIFHREDYFSAIKSTFIAIETGQSRWVLLVRKLITKVMLDVFLKNCRIFVWKKISNFIYITSLIMGFVTLKSYFLV